MAERPRDRAGIAFLILWIVVWTSAILVAIWIMGGAALRGEIVPLVFLVAWIAAALFALRSAVRKLLRLLVGGGAERKPHPRHHWEDGIDDGL